MENFALMMAQPIPELSLELDDVETFSFYESLLAEVVEAEFKYPFYFFPNLPAGVLFGSRVPLFQNQGITLPESKICHSRLHPFLPGFQ